MFYENLSVGQAVRTASVEVTADEIISFAGRYDPQPFHTDAVAANA